MSAPNTMESKFHFGNFPVRVVGTKDDPEWVAVDVCKALGIKNAPQAVRPVPDDEKGIYKVYTPGGEQGLSTLKEPGLYRLIFRSNKPEAEEFRRWVFREVLPSIRKTGSFQEPKPAVSNAELLEVVQAMEKKQRADSEYQNRMFSVILSFSGKALATARNHRPKNPNQQPLPFPEEKKQLGEDLGAGS